MQPSFTWQDVIRLTGITACQLEWWDERLVVPARERHRRIYSLKDLTKVAVVRELRRKEVSFEPMRKLVWFLKREFPRPLAGTVRGSSNYHLLTDGRAHYLGTSKHEIVGLLKNSWQPMIDICLSDTVRQLEASSAEGNAPAAVVRRKRVPCARRNRVSGEFALRRVEWLLSSKS